MSDNTMVTLVTEAGRGTTEKPFTIQHAENLLKYQQKKGFKDWRIADNSPFKFENGTINPTKPGSVKEASK